MSRTASRLASAGLALVALAACGGADDAAPRADAVVLNRGNAEEPRSLDPHHVHSAWERRIVEDMFVGLFMRGADGEPVPGMAEHWTVSGDGLVWTFTLRDAFWSDGVAVTSDDFVFSLRRALAPATKAGDAAFLYVIENAELVHAGVTPPDRLGVRALDSRRLEVRLEHPAPYLPGLLTHPAAMPTPPHALRDLGASWASSSDIVVNGPYRLVEWRAHDVIRLARNERYFENDDVCIDEVRYFPITDTNVAARRVRNGELDVNVGLPTLSAEFFGDQTSTVVRTHPRMSAELVVFNTRLDVFSDARVRAALSMAIDRAFIVANVLGDGQEPAYALASPFTSGLDGAASVPWRNRPVEARRAEARRLLEAAGFGSEKPLRFAFAHRDSDEHAAVAAVLLSNWRQIAPWVDAELAPLEPAIHDANLRLGDFEVADVGWAASFDDPLALLLLFETRAGGLNHSGWSDERYDALLAQSSRERDPAARAALLAEAEQILLDAVPVAPVWRGVTRNLVGPRVTGWVDNAADAHPTRSLCVVGGESAEAGPVTAP